MPDRIPTGITRQLLVAAITDLDKGVPHAFGESTGYDVLYQGHRYPPKAVVGLAAARIVGSPLGAHDFKGCLGTRCFAVLMENGFTIVTKGDTNRSQKKSMTKNHTSRVPYRPCALTVTNVITRREKDVLRTTVCPNCHAMLHKRIPPYSIDELSKLIRKGG